MYVCMVCCIPHSFLVLPKQLPWLSSSHGADIVQGYASFSPETKGIEIKIILLHFAYAILQQFLFCCLYLSISTCTVFLVNVVHLKMKVTCGAHLQFCTWVTMRNSKRTVSVFMVSWLFIVFIVLLFHTSRKAHRLHCYTVWSVYSVSSFYSALACYVATMTLFLFRNRRCYSQYL